MKVKIKNIKTEVVKEVDNNILSDYLSTKEWKKVDDKTKKIQPQAPKPSSNFSNLNNQEENDKI